MSIPKTWWIEKKHKQHSLPVAIPQMKENCVKTKIILKQ